MKMKLLTLAMMIATTFNANASVVFEVEGELKIKGVLESASLPQMEIISKGRKLVISDVRENIFACKQGKFEVVDSSMIPTGEYTLVSMVECYEENTINKTEFINNVACPEVYSPVCGETGFGLMTFSNACELSTSSASFVHSGRCE